MKTFHSLLLATLLLLSCKKDDGALRMTLLDAPPLSFDLLEVPLNATKVSLTPTLRWESAENPKGGAVTYELFLGEETDPVNLYKSGIQNTSIELTEKLKLETDYHWKVVAKSANGQTSQSDIFKFTTRYYKLADTATATSTDFSPRLGHTSATFNNKMWIFGGRDADDLRKNDVWQSDDGIVWSEISGNMPFTAQTHHSTAVFDNKLWVIAGGAIFSSSSKNSIWNSDDGVNWVATTLDTPFSARGRHSTVVFDNKIWVIAGVGLGSFKNDIWHSGDGTNWTEVTPAAQFSARAGHSSVVFDGKIWVIGGNIGSGSLANDVWFSTDGLNWTQATPAAPFTQRAGHSTVVFDDKIWVIGGRGSQNSDLKKDIWYSNDGVNWTEAPTAVLFSERWGHSTTVFDNKLWIIGGGDYDPLKNDVWILE